MTEVAVEEAEGEQGANHRTVSEQHHHKGEEIGMEVRKENDSAHGPQSTIQGRRVQRRSQKDHIGIRQETC